MVSYVVKERFDMIAISIGPYPQHVRWYWLSFALQSSLLPLIDTGNVLRDFPDGEICSLPYGFEIIFKYGL